MNCSRNGSPIYPPAVLNEFYLRVAQGVEPGYSFIEKFGENPDVNGVMEDVWSQGGMYVYSTTADIDTISSSNIGDGQQITIVGQLADNTEVTQTATLNGQSKVTLSTPLFRVYRAFNIGSTDFAGDVYIYPDTAIVTGVPTNPAFIRVKIISDSNQTEMALYTIPKGKQGFFLGGYVSMNNSLANNFATFTWRLRLLGQVFRVQSRISCTGSGASHWAYHYDIPNGPIPAGTDIVVSVDEVGTANTACAAGFTILLQDT